MPWRYSPDLGTDIRRAENNGAYTNRMHNLYTKTRRYPPPKGGDYRQWNNANINRPYNGGKLGWGTVTGNKTTDREQPFNGTLNVNPGGTWKDSVKDDGSHNSYISTDWQNESIPNVGSCYTIPNTDKMFSVGYATTDNTKWNIPAKSIPILDSGVHIEFGEYETYSRPYHSPETTAINGGVDIRYTLSMFKLNFCFPKPEPGVTMTLISGTYDDGVCQYISPSTGLPVQVTTKCINIPATSPYVSNTHVSSSTQEYNEWTLDVTLLELYQELVTLTGAKTGNKINVVDLYLLNIEAIPTAPAQMCNIDFPLTIPVPDGQGGIIYVPNTPINPAQFQMRLHEMRYNTVMVR